MKFKTILTAVPLWSVSIAAMGYFLFYQLVCAGTVNAVHRSWIGLFFAVSALITFGYTLYCGIMAVLYRPVPTPAERSGLPGCTVIVPAYNEGEHVFETIESLVKSDYPEDKLEIIAINDGSGDDTWNWICRAAREFPQVRSVNLHRNQGKKQALVRGIQMASHEIIVTVDSDSIVRQKSLQAIVVPFADPAVYAVAGNIRIKNLAAGILPRMMDVGFMFGFEVVRCAQSVSGCVMCTPGAMSAYRRSSLLPLLEAWLNQRFLNVEAKIGEDRAIATMLLKSGGRIVFQRDAVADTCIPAEYGSFCKMLLRWTRSDIRENWLILKHTLLHPAPLKRQYLDMVIHNMFQISNTILPALIVPLLGSSLLLQIPQEMIRNLYAGVSFGLIGALIPASIYARRVSALNSVWALVYSVYSVFALSWIALYSFFTLRNTSWLTRTLSSAENRKINVASFTKLCRK